MTTDASPDPCPDGTACVFADCDGTADWHTRTEADARLAAMTFGPCPEGDACNVPHCDGSDLGHTLAVDFPSETAQFDAAMDGMRERIMEAIRADHDLTLHPPELWGNGEGQCGHPDCERTRP